MMNVDRWRNRMCFRHRFRIAIVAPMTVMTVVDLAGFGLYGGLRVVGQAIVAQFLRQSQFSVTLPSRAIYQDASCEVLAFRLLSPVVLFAVWYWASKHLRLKVLYAQLGDFATAHSGLPTSRRSKDSQVWSDSGALCN
jgi:hypothetical protein